MGILQSIISVFTTNGISLEIGLILALGFSAVLMGLQDWRIALISFFVGSTLEYILFFFLGLNMDIITYVLFASIILMAFSIFVTRNGGQLA